jgi:hypothetical protein
MDTEPSDVDWLNGLVYGIKGPQAQIIRARISEFEVLKAINKAKESALYHQIQAEIEAAKAH